MGKLLNFFKFLEEVEDQVMPFKLQLQTGAINSGEISDTYLNPDVTDDVDLDLANVPRDAYFDSLSIEGYRTVEFPSKLEVTGELSLTSIEDIVHQGTVQCIDLSAYNVRGLKLSTVLELYEVSDSIVIALSGTHNLPDSLSPKAPKRLEINGYTPFEILGGSSSLDLAKTAVEIVRADTVDFSKNAHTFRELDLSTCSGDVEIHPQTRIGIARFSIDCSMVQDFKDSFESESGEIVGISADVGDLENYVQSKFPNIQVLMLS